MLKLYEAADRIEAQLLMDFLAGYHIETVLQGDYLTGAAGELPANSFPVIWVVENEDLPRARELLADFHSTRAPTGEADPAHWECRHCGERVEQAFELCWNCGKARHR